MTSTPANLRSEKFRLLPDELVRQLLEYLALRPYIEVHQLIPQLLQTEEQVATTLQEDKQDA